MGPPLKQDTALHIIRIVDRLGSRASFRNILLEANSEGVVAWHRTLRRYLDLLVDARILNLRERDVGSVRPQQLYTKVNSLAHLWTGLAVFKLHGLNWEVPDADLYKVRTDLEAMVRARPYTISGRGKLIAGLEDSLIYEVKKDAAERRGTTELVASILATRTVDLPYMLRRADLQQTGQTIRQLFKKITGTFTALPGDTEGRVFLETRTVFLKILREYNSKGLPKLVEARGRGRLGMAIVEGLSPAQIVSAAGKQLGVSG